MTQTLTIARRELSSLFFSPIAYIVLGLFCFGVALVFCLSTLYPDTPASLRSTLNGIIWLWILLMPGISMRLFSEELRYGTVELLLTAPVTDTQVVMGKWLGAMGFLGAMMLPVAVCLAVLEYNSNPDYGPILAGLLGVVLVAGLYLSIGAFASASTQNQIIAYFFALFAILVLTFLMQFCSGWDTLPKALRGVADYLCVFRRFERFDMGWIEATNIIYFATGIGLFLFLTVKLLESRKWR